MAGLTEGPHTLWVRGVDKSTPANVSATARIAQFSFVVDQTDPVASIVDGPDEDEVIADSTPDFTFAALNEIEGGVKFECRIDGGVVPEPTEEDPDPEGAWEACGETTADEPVTTTLDELEDGEHSLEVRAVDEAGNTGESVSRTFTVDTTGPVTTFTATPDEITNQLDATFGFEADDAAATFECSIDNGDFEDCESPYALTDLEPGDHLLIVSATDALGNVGPDKTFEWSIDVRLPKVTIESGPPARTNVTDAEFTFSADEDNTEFECRLDNGAWASCVSPRSLTGLSAGEHTFDVRATDEAGNVSLTASSTWSIDLVNPSATITNKPPAQHP